MRPCIKVDRAAVKAALEALGRPAEQVHVEAAAALIAGYADVAAAAIVPLEPTQGLLISMALRDDHGFLSAGPDEADGPLLVGPTQAERETRLRSMRQLHEEVVGTGFHGPKREGWYLEGMEGLARMRAAKASRAGGAAS